jgi:hypothetical protein
VLLLLNVVLTLRPSLLLPPRLFLCVMPS